MFIYFLEKERQSANGGGAEREGDTESEAGSRLWAVSTEPDTGLKLTNREIMTWAEVGHPTEWATQAPLKDMFLKFIYFWDRERQRETEHEQGRGRERGRHRIWNGLQALSCQHRAWHRAWTHGPGDHDLSWSQMLNWLSHPGTPDYFPFYCWFLGIFCQ